MSSVSDKIQLAKYTSEALTGNNATLLFISCNYLAELLVYVNTSLAMRGSQIPEYSEEQLKRLPTLDATYRGLKIIRIIEPNIIVVN